MRRVAIVGAGIAGLGSAHLLQNQFDVTVFDGNSYAGGHTNTVEVDEDGKAVPIDTGFMVYNPVTYPNLTRLFLDLGVSSFATDMSFSVQHRSTEWCGSSLNQVFGQRKNLLNPSFWQFAFELDRFNKQAELDYNQPWVEDLTIQGYANRHGFSRQLLDLYLLPMGSAIWSTPPSTMLQFPAATLLRFFHNHRFNAGLDGHLQWFTVTGGAKEYVKKLTAPFAHKIKLGVPVFRVLEREGKVRVTLANNEQHEFDLVIMAAHADESLKMLSAPSELEQNLLKHFEYSTNHTLLHTDRKVMPSTERCWAAWNYRIEQQNGSLIPTTHYWMNRLQNVSNRKNYFVSLNADHLVDERTILKRITYTHPVFDKHTAQAQRDLHLLNSDDRLIRFCGSYFAYGFHEDAYTSAVNLCSKLLGEPVCTT